MPKGEGRTNIDWSWLSSKPEYSHLVCMLLVLQLNCIGNITFEITCNMYILKLRKLTFSKTHLLSFIKLNTKWNTFEIS